MEDTCVSSNLIALFSTPGHIETAFRADDAILRPRTLKLVEHWRIAGPACELMLPITGDNV
jgi:hypothetical protein